MDTHKALIFLPRRLPPDILREIFVACLPTNRNAVMSAQEAPLLLCRICSAWRTMALSTMRLWASLHVPFDFILAKEPRVPAVTQWLERSAACPISLSVTDSTEAGRVIWTDEVEGKLYSARCAALIRSLAEFSCRWRHTEFKNMPLDMAHELTEITTPLFESFEFSGWIRVFVQLDFFEVPSLRTLSLRLQGTESLDDFALHRPLPWNRLRHLILVSNSNGNSLSIRDIIGLLGRCRQLISIHTVPDLAGAEADIVSPPSSLPSLQSFTLSSRFLPPRPLALLIEHLSMPQLRQFHVGATTCEYEAQHSSFLVALGTKSSLIKDLTIYLLSLTTQSPAETLRSFASLFRLDVFDTEIWDWANELFEPCDADAKQLPQLLADMTVCSSLQELMVHNCTGLEQTTLDAFVQARIWTAHRLRRLEITFKETWSPMVSLMSEAEIQSYFSLGLQILLFYDHSWVTHDHLALPGPWTGLLRENV